MGAEGSRPEGSGEADLLGVGNGCGWEAATALPPGRRHDCTESSGSGALLRGEALPSLLLGRLSASGAGRWLRERGGVYRAAMDAGTLDCSS